MKQKILLAVPTMGIGGAQRLVTDLAEKLDASRFTVTVLILSGRTGSIFEEKLDKLAVQSIYLNKSAGPHPRMILHVIRLLRQMKPDVVHTHLHVLPYLLPGMMLAKVPVRLHTIHSAAEKESAGFLRLVSRFAFLFGGVTPVAVGKDVRRTIMDLYHLEKEQVPCVPNGVRNRILRHETHKSQNTQNTHKSHFSKKAYPCQLISIGALWEVKNHALLIEAFHLASLQNPGLRLTILGEGVLRAQLQEMVYSYQLESKVSLPGICNDVYKELQKADLFVLSSNYEGMPFCLLEAMSCALPVISTRVCGAAELIRDRVNGMLCKTGDAKALADAILYLSGDRKRLQKMGEAALQTARRYDLSGMVVGYETLYKGACR